MLQREFCEDCKQACRRCSGVRPAARSSAAHAQSIAFHRILSNVTCRRAASLLKTHSERLLQSRVYVETMHANHGTASAAFLPIAQRQAAGLAAVVHQARGTRKVTAAVSAAHVGRIRSTRAVPRVFWNRPQPNQYSCVTAKPLVCTSLSSRQPDDQRVTISCGAQANAEAAYQGHLLSRLLSNWRARAGLC